MENAEEITDTNTVIEGQVKYRDGKKWKSRWCVVRKLSPVADCLNLQLFRESKDKYKQGQTKANLSLEGYLGIESGFTLDKESHTLAILCQDVTVILAFDSREILIQWQVKIRNNLGEEQYYQVQVALAPPKSKISAGPARLHVQDRVFCLVAGLPPRVLQSWNIQDLRKYGVVDGKFCFEGGSRCGKGEGLHVLISNQAEEMTATLDFASQGKLQNKTRATVGKTSTKDQSLRSPLQLSNKTSEHKGEMCSAESTRPLLNSSDSGICDACSEIVMATGEYWPSTESRNLENVNPMPAAEAGDSGPHQGWIPEAGSYLVDRVALLERCSKHKCCTANDVTSNEMTEGGSGENKIADGLSLSSQGSSSSASESSVPVRPCCESYYDKPKHLATMLENYPMPPGNLQKPSKSSGQIIMTKLPVTPTKTLKVGTRNLSKPNACSCMDVKQINVESAQTVAPLPLGTPVKCNCSFASTKDNPAYVRTPGSHNNTPLCSPKKLASQFVSFCNTAPNSNSPTKAKPNVQLNLSTPFRHNALKSTSPGSTISSPNVCTCYNPYEDYAIPRSALSALGSKGQDNVSVCDPANNQKSTPQNLLSPAENNYDIPRRIKDCMISVNRKETPQANKTNLCIKNLQCEVDVTRSHLPPCSAVSRNEPLHPMVSNCPCQRVFHWAEHLMLCRKRQNYDEGDIICLHQIFHESKATSIPHEGCVHVKHSCSCSDTQEKHVSTNSSVKTSVCNVHISMPYTTQSTCDTHSSIKASKVASQAVKTSLAQKDIPNYANVQFQNARKKPNEQGREKENSMGNYANLEFVESLHFYENTCVVKAKSGIKPENKKRAEDPQEDIAKVSEDILSSSHLNYLGTDGKMKEGSFANSALASESGNVPEVYGVEAKCTNCGHHYVKVIPDFRSNKGQTSNDNQKNDSSNSNYLLMQPISAQCLSDDSQQISGPLASNQKTNENTSQDNYAISSERQCEYMSMSKIAEDSKCLPLRPFMPLQLFIKRKDEESYDERCRGRSGFSNRNSTMKNSTLTRSISFEPRTVRSNSVVELKKRVFLRKRSSSADGRQERHDEVSGTNEFSGITSPEQKLPFIKCHISKCKINHGGYGYSKSTDSSQFSSPKNRSDESLEKSANELDTFNVNVVLRNFQASGDNSDSLSSIKRSSSVPCNPGNRDSASSSDSGVSAGSPKQMSTFPSSGEGIYMEMAMIRANANMFTNIEDSKGLHHRICHHDLCRNISLDSEASLWIKREDLKDGSLSPSQEMMNQHYYVDSKSTSSTSDMSDYIETLSLSSHGSNDMQRLEESSPCPKHPTTSCTLRPRSGREYQMLDRVLLEECLLKNASHDCSKGGMSSSTHCIYEHSKIVSSSSVLTDMCKSPSHTCTNQCNYTSQGKQETSNSIDTKPFDPPNVNSPISVSDAESVHYPCSTAQKHND